MRFKPFFGLFLIFVIGVFGLLFKGKPGTPFLAYQSSKSSEVGSPFESTNSTSRYALVEAMASGRFDLTEDQARFSAPDLIYYQGRFFSIFTPGVAFVALPFYLLGQIVGLPQVLTYLTTIGLAVLNFFLMIWLGRKLHLSLPASTLAALVFSFGTNALVYALTLTQHTATVTLLLLALANALANRRTWANNLAFGALYGASLLIDFPNVLLLAPIGIFVLSKNILTSENQQQYLIDIKWAVMGLVLGTLPFLGLFGWYNYQMTGSPVKFGQTMTRSDYFDTEEQKAVTRQMTLNHDIYAPKLPFSTRAEMQGFTLLLLSNERSWLYFSPVVLLGLVGLWLASHQTRTKKMAIVFGSIVATNILLYSMFGDPWGGWSFGPRYLIPGAVVLCLSLGFVFEQAVKKKLLAVLLISLSLFSFYISIAGALTTAALPPKVEAEHLQSPIPYTFEYNFQKLAQNQVSSLAYNATLKNLLPGAWYHRMVVGGVSAVFLGLFLRLYRERRKVVHD